MPKKCRMFILCLPALMILGGGDLYADSAGPSFPVLKIGDEAPWFTLPSSEDRLVDYYKDYFGKHHLVMTFFPAAFTPTWTGEMEAHNRDLYLYQRLNARVLGVSMDDPVTNKHFAKSLDLQFPLISNVLPWMGMKYGAYSYTPPFRPDGTPNWFGRRTVIIDKNGIVRSIMDGSPNNQEILQFLLKLEKEFREKK